MAAPAGSGFDPAKPLIVVIFITAIITGGFAIKFYREYDTWDRRLVTDMQKWRGVQPTDRETMVIEGAETVRDRIRRINETIGDLPPEVVSTEDPYKNVGSFLTERAAKYDLQLLKYEEKVDKPRGREEGRFGFELKEITREQLVNFLYDVESQRPVLKTLEISNFRQALPKSDDFTEWNCKVVIAYRRAVSEPKDE